MASKRLLSGIKASYPLRLSCLMMFLIGGVYGLAGSNPLGVTATPDMDCVVVLDGKVVGRLASGKVGFFPIGKGKHTLAAASQDGDYWEQQVEVTGEPSTALVIPLHKAHFERLALQSDVSALRAEVAKKKEQLVTIENRNEEQVRNAEVVRGERRLIVDAINQYANHYGKELGLHDDMETTGNALMTEISKPMSNPDSNAEAGVKLAEMIIAGIAFWNGHHHNVVANRIRERMGELQEALKDPLKNPRKIPEQQNYLFTVRMVTRKKMPGEVITGPNQVDYRDEQQNVHLSCGTIRGASGSKNVNIRYVEVDSRKRKHKRTLHLKARSKKEGRLLATDVLLACPKD